MPRDPEKTKVGVWLSPDERKALAKTLDHLGVKTFADLARTLITASDWPQSRIDALAALFSTSKKSKDTRTECVLIRIRPGEFLALKSVAEDAQRDPDELIYDLLRKELKIPFNFGGRHAVAQEIGPLNASEEILHLKNQLRKLETMEEVEVNRAGQPKFKPSKIAPEGTPFKSIDDDESKLSPRALAATIEALKDNPEALMAVEQALDGLVQSDGLTDIVYHGHPAAKPVREVLHALADLDPEVDATLIERRLPGLVELRRGWARMMLHAKTDQTI